MGVQACGGGGPRVADEIELPPGFTAYEFADGLQAPTVLRFDSEGRLFVAELEGRISLLEDTNADGRADSKRLLWEGFGWLLGLAFHPDNGSLYVSHREKIAILDDPYAGGSAGVSVQIIEDLPSGAHQNNGIAFGPDGRLYITLGSTCNVCDEEDERSAAILVANDDGSDLQVYARGMRNIYDLAFDNQGRLWAPVNERDQWEPSDPPYQTIDDVPDELNLIVEGGHYGWPGCAGGQEAIPGGCTGTLPAVVEFETNSSSNGIVFYQSGSFPQEYHGSFFVTQWGSDPRAPNQVVPKVVHVTIEEANGEFTGEWEEFATGFVRPLPIAIAPDGALFVGDWEAGRIYRIVWEGP